MENLIRLLMRFLLVPLGYFAASIAGTLVVLIASWQLVDMAISGHPDGPAFALLGFAIGGPILLLFVLVFMLLPASIGILISEAFAIRSWIFHVLNGVASAWLGWQLYGERRRHASDAVRSAAGGDRGRHRRRVRLLGGGGLQRGLLQADIPRDPPPSVPATTRSLALISRIARRNCRFHAARSDARKVRAERGGVHVRAYEYLRAHRIVPGRLRAAAGGDRGRLRPCGDFVSPIRFLADAQPRSMPGSGAQTALIRL